MKVYLAGKISDYDEWRHKIVKGLFNTNEKHPTTFVEDEYANNGVPPWPIMEKTMPGGHDYVGPYYIRDNHWMFYGWGSYHTNKPIVFSRCIDAIKKADVVFAYIARDWWGDMVDDAPACNAITAYGSIAELGMAHALGKEIYIASPTEYSDLWFVYQMAKKTIFGMSPLEAFVALVPPERIDYHEYIRSDKWREKANAAKARAGQRCQICNKPRSEVTLDAHHRTYERLGAEEPEDITVLCRDCHSLYELNKKKKGER